MRQVACYCFIAALLAAVSPLPSVAQVGGAISRHYQFSGCYELRLESEPDWARGLERRVRLTMVELASHPDLVVHEFLMRPVAGEPASDYERPHWLLVGNRSPLVLEWESPGYVWIRAEFGVQDLHQIPETGLPGALSYSDHQPGATPDAVPVAIVPIECL